MPLTILTDKDVCALLDTLGREDLLDMHKSLSQALHIYSTALDDDESGCSASKQPHRISIKRKDGSVALIMPASSDDALGVKLVTVSEDKKEGPDAQLPLRVNTNSSSKSNSISSESRSARSPSSRTPTSSTSSAVPSPSSSRTDVGREGSVSTVSSESAANKSNIVTELPLGMELPEPDATSPKGSLTLLDNDGRPRALINASTMTAFRTALASTMIFKARQNVHTLVVFGAGLQAYWHIHLALLLRQTEIHRVHVINRSFDRAQRMMIKLAQSENPELSEAFLGRKLSPSILTPEYGEYDRLLKEYVRTSDVIFCCTPSTTPLFPPGHLTHSEGRRKARYVAAIGSYKPHMCELHPDILQQAVQGPRSSHSHGLHIKQNHANEGGAVIVDSIEGAMKEAGEIIQAKISGQGVVELGELVMLKKSHWKDKAESEKREIERREQEMRKRDSDAKSTSSQGNGNEGKHHLFGGHGLGHLFKHSHDDDQGPRDTYREMGVAKSHPNDGGLGDWLQRGNVIYKSVGIGLMDVVVGMELVRLAEERGFGTFVPDF